MNAIYLVSRLNRWSGECSPIRAFSSRAAADAFIAAAKVEGKRIDSLPELDGEWNAFEAEYGFLAIEAPELTCRAIDFTAK